MSEESALLSLRKLGEEIYESLMNKTFPILRIPSRSTSNIIYDKKLRQFVLGNKRKIRSAKNIRHIRSFTNLLWVALFSSELIKSGRTSTLRDVFYSAQAYGISFRDQSESDETIADLEALLGYPREILHIFPEERSAIYGDLEIEYTVKGYEGRRLNLTVHPDGVMIGPALSRAKFVGTSADKVIVVEKGAMFSRLIEERAHEKFNAILVHTAGQPPRATRFLIRRLWKELGLKVFIFTDADPWGMHIAMVIISGSANSAHIEGLATPDAVWAGVWATDILEYELPSDPLTERDIKRLKELRSDPRYRGKLWQREISTFFKHKRKSEQEAFARYGLTFIVDKYLPDKLSQYGG